MRATSYTTVIVFSLALVACASTSNKPPQAPAGQTAPPVTQADITSTPSPMAADAPKDMSINKLSVDPQKIVRIRGVISSILGIRMVPPKTIMKFTDLSGTTTVQINELLQLKEGAKLELVGKYDSIPAPLAPDGQAAAKEDVFIVERYMELP